jgi:hypothetical protein
MKEIPFAWFPADARTPVVCGHRTQRIGGNGVSEGCAERLEV